MLYYPSTEAQASGSEKRHQKNSKEFESFPKHCILGTEEVELIDELKPYEKDMKLIRKNSTSGFVTEEFQKYLKENENNLEEIIITGCCTDICIINFAKTFYSTGCVYGIADDCIFHAVFSSDISG